MNKYGQSAIAAVEKYLLGKTQSPRESWNWAVNRFFTTSASRNKGCPRDTFLGLCSEGLLIGIPPGNYTRSKKNKKYAMKAVALLRQNELLVEDPGRLWELVMEGETKTPNQQMEVVIALWEKEMIKK